VPRTVSLVPVTLVWAGTGAQFRAWPATPFQAGSGAASRRGRRPRSRTEAAPSQGVPGDPVPGRKRRSLRALPTTVTELQAMARAASAGGMTSSIARGTSTRL
jgi:hypothetical protein